MYVSQEQLGDDKLIYDARSGRFYEKKLEEVCREEYCAIDETTGEEQRNRGKGEGMMRRTRERERQHSKQHQFYISSDCRQGERKEAVNGESEIWLLCTFN